MFHYWNVASRELSPRMAAVIRSKERADDGCEIMKKMAIVVYHNRFVYE